MAERYSAPTGKRDRWMVSFDTASIVEAVSFSLGGASIAFDLRELLFAIAAFVSHTTKKESVNRELVGTVSERHGVQLWFQAERIPQSFSLSE